MGKEIVGYEKWHIGEEYDNCWYYCKNPDGKYPDNEWRHSYIDHIQKDQWIGLKDLDKKEIYEGDKVLIGIEEMKTQEEFIVKWDGDCARFIFEYPDGNGEYYYGEIIPSEREMKRIGTIYENEIRKKKDKSIFYRRKNKRKMQIIDQKNKEVK